MSKNPLWKLPFFEELYSEIVAKVDKGFRTTMSGSETERDFLVVGTFLSIVSDPALREPYGKCETLWGCLSKMKSNWPQDGDYRDYTEMFSLLSGRQLAQAERFWTARKVAQTLRNGP